MKLLLILLFFFSTVQAHDSINNDCDQLSRNTFIPQAFITSVQQNSYWALLGEQLILCYGIDPYTGKPACTAIPKQYIVIELPYKLQ